MWRAIIWETFATESFGRPVILEVRRTLPGASTLACSTDLQDGTLDGARRKDRRLFPSAATFALGANIECQRDGGFLDAEEQPCIFFYTPVSIPEKESESACQQDRHEAES